MIQARRMGGAVGATAPPQMRCRLKRSTFFKISTRFLSRIDVLTRSHAFCRELTFKHI